VDGEADLLGDGEVVGGVEVGCGVGRHEAVLVGWGVAVLDVLGEGLPVLLGVGVGVGVGSALHCWLAAET
jgi:hypothetical protein